MDILIWILQGLLGAAFLMAGLGKTFGSKMHKEAFKKWQLPQWFRVVTGLVELVAAVLLIAGFLQKDLVLYGALMIVAIGIGGLLTHIRVKDSMKESMPIIVLGVLGLVLTLFVL
ncbi:DoxX family protein [Bacillus luti]|uniref:DoxX family protein n=1 Tax=Bacillus luti TaxID=2026191 RepID=A0A7V7V5I7_9BACI|nr:DoxX family protein [Bacillus luti]KAB2443665.1 DoxX family protein [Bacillus luti]